MKRWWGEKPVTVEAFETQQEKLRRLSMEVIAEYEKRLDAEIRDPQRLDAMYGSAFASGDARYQAETVAMLASSMLNVPNADVTLVLSDRQVRVASVAEGNIIAPRDSTPLPDSYCKHVIGTGREFAVGDSLEHPLVCDTRFARSGQITSYLGVPITDMEKMIVGVLCVYDERERDWSAADVAMLTQLSFTLTRALAMQTASGQAVAPVVP